MTQFKVENRVISVVEPMSITSDSDLRLDSNKIVLDTTNDYTLNDMGNKLCNENDVSTVPVIAPVVVESNVTSSVTGETDMTSGGNLTCNMASCEQTTNETLSDRDNNLTHRKNVLSAELPQMRMTSRGNVPNFSLTPIWPGYPQLGCYQYHQPIVLGSLWWRLWSIVIN